MCKVDAAGYIATISRKLPMSEVNNATSVSLEYLNTVVSND